MTKDNELSEIECFKGLARLGVLSDEGLNQLCELMDKNIKEKPPRPKKAYIVLSRRNIQNLLDLVVKRSIEGGYRSAVPFRATIESAINDSEAGEVQVNINFFETLRPEEQKSFQTNKGRLE